MIRTSPAGIESVNGLTEANGATSSAVSSANHLDQQIDSEPVGEHDCLGAAVGGRVEEFQRSAASGGRNALARVAGRVAYWGHCKLCRKSLIAILMSEAEKLSIKFDLAGIARAPNARSIAP